MNSSSTPPVSFLRRRKFVLLALGLVLLLMMFAPRVVGMTSLRQSLGGFLLPEFEGKISIGRASLGWLSAIRLEEVNIVDANGQPLAEVDALVTSRPLLGYLLDRSDLGQLKVVRPRVHLQLRSDGSNLEDALQPLLSKPASSSSTPLEVVIDDGQIDVTAAGGRHWQIDQIQATIESGQPEATITCEVSADIASADRPPGSINANLFLEPAAAGTTPAGTASLEAKMVPLDLLAPVLNRWTPQVRTAGLLTGRASGRWQQGAEGFQVDFHQCHGTNVFFACPAWIGQDQLAVQNLTAEGTLQQMAGQLTAQQLVVDSDFGRLEADGILDPNQWIASVQAGSDPAPFQLTGKIDLPRLAKALPQTLRLKENVVVETGDVSLVAYQRQEGIHQRLFIGLEAVNVALRRGDARFALERPWRLTGAVRQSHDQTELEFLSGQSDFLNIEGSGSLAQGKLTARGNLLTLRQQLAPFVDFRDFQFQGHVQANLQWQTDPATSLSPSADGTPTAKRTKIDAQIQVEDFAVGTPQRPLWQDRNASLNVAAVCDLTTSGIASIETGTVNYRSAEDQLSIQLLQPVKQPTLQSTAMIQYGLSGDLSQWLARISGGSLLSDWQVEGQVRTAGHASISSTRIAAQNAQLELEPCRARGSGWQIDEPKIVGQFNLDWDVQGQVVQLQQMALSSSTIALSSSQLQLHLDQPALAPVGTCAFRCDLHRVSNLAARPGPNTHAFYGMVVGNANFTGPSDPSQLQLSMRMDDFVYARPKNPSHTTATASPPQWVPVWQEKRVDLSSAIAYDQTNDTLTVTSLAVDATALKLQVDGSATRMTGPCVVNATGQLQCDLPQLALQLQDWLGDEVQLSGNQPVSFSIQGPLFNTANTAAAPTTGAVHSVGLNREPVENRPLVPAELRGSAAAGWESGQIFGLNFGGGRIDGQLESRRIRFAPLNLSVGGGQLEVAPQILLEGPAAVIDLQQHTRIQRVHLSPELCRRWIKYAAPAVGDATRTEGTFSATVQRAQLPVADPFGGVADGVLVLHQGKFGPGPLGNEFLDLAQQIKVLLEGNPLAAPIADRDNWLELREQQIPFRLVNRRVYHERFAIHIKDAVIYTRGSVGEDQSLDLVASIPIQEHWLKDRRLAAVLSGTTVEIPIRGTITQPRFDREAFKEFARKAVGQATENLLREGLLRGLDRLIDPGQPN